mgnify:CR=1 FL=1
MKVLYINIKLLQRELHENIKTNTLHSRRERGAFLGGTKSGSLIFDYIFFLSIKTRERNSHRQIDFQ